MFYNQRITISEQGEDRVLSEIYTSIKAQVYKKTVRMDRAIAENTSKEVIVVLIDPQHTLVKAWNIIKYTDNWGRTVKLKANDPDLVQANYFWPLIQIQCDLL